MKTLAITLALMCISLVHFGKTSVQNLTVHFNSDQYVLLSDEQSRIEDFFKKYFPSGDFEVQIKGHTDHEGNFDYNKKLSLLRAESVKNLIVSQGIDPSQCKIEWFGETKLLTSDIDEYSKAKNRRVEITLKLYNFESYSELINELSRSSINKFVFDSHDEILLECSKGTKLSIDENSFLNADSTLYEGKIQLEIIEAIETTDFLINGLATISDGKILKSGGMVKTSAQSEDGKELILSNENRFNLAIPSMNTSFSGYKLFTSETGNDWTETTEIPLQNFKLNIPPRPILTVQYVKNKIPRFDESTKPYKPVEPVYPRQPTKPRWTSYETEIKWFEIFSAKSKRKRDSARFEDSMMRYRARMKSYEQEIAVFDERCSKYPDDLEIYYERLNDWYQEKAAFIKEHSQDPKYVVADPNNYDAAIKLYQQRLKEWQIIRDKAEDQYLAELDKMELSPDLNLNYFIFKNTGLGWANCDRFYSVPEDAKMNLTVSVSDQSDYEVFLVFKGERIVIPLTPNGKNEYIVNAIPAYQLGTIISYQIRDGKIYYAETEFNGNPRYKLKFEPITCTKLKRKFNNIGSELS